MRLITARYVALLRFLKLSFVFILVTVLPGRQPHLHAGGPLCYREAPHACSRH